MAQFHLSYVLTTRNKLPLLREVMSRLLAQRRPDEEIVVIDAASTDGTAEYLRSLHEGGEIQQFRSEPDRGEAHGLNKGLLMARGTIIKLLSDDDVYCWPAIRECREFMLARPEVDVIGGLTANTDFENPAEILVMRHFQGDAQDWLAGRAKRFFSNGLPLMVRRERLPLLGLFHTGFVSVDLEFTLRVTGLANFGWYDSVVAIRIDNAASNYRTRRDVVEREFKQMMALYDDWVRYEERHRPPPPTRWQRLRAMPGRVRARLRRALAGTPPPEPAPPPPPRPGLEPAEVFRICERWLESYRREHPGRVRVREPRL